MWVKETFFLCETRRDCLKAAAICMQKYRKQGRREVCGGMHKGDGNLTGDVCTRNDGWLGTGVSADNSTKRKQRGDGTGKLCAR